MSGDFVRILGCRGSAAVSGAEFALFGGATSAYEVRLGGRTVILDAGTGLLSYRGDEPELDILLSHPHLDHLSGLCLSQPALTPGRTLRIYGENISEGLERLYSPPLWPVGVSGLPAKTEVYNTLPESLGDIKITSMPGVHPGGVSVIRLDCGNKSIVYSTDCTITEDNFPALSEFAGGCDILLADGQYSDGEWPRRSSFGHSKWTAAAELGNGCGAKKTILIHHDPMHTDAELLAAERELREKYENCAFGREGVTYYL